MALTDKLTTIANAIRSKTGKSDALTLDQMVTEIEGISAGGSTEEWIGDGNTHIWITLAEGRTSPMLGVCPKGTVTVDWGDGTTPDTLTGTSTSTVKWTPTHNYAAPGDYMITLTVDGEMGLNGDSSSATSLLRHTSDSDDRNKAYQHVIRKVEIGDGATLIKKYAFFGCNVLTSVIISASEIYIQESAFYMCNSLSSVIIPDGLTTIENNTFASCRALSSITIPRSVTSIGKSVFSSCVSLTGIVIPDGLTTIKDSTFSACNALSSVTIPSSVTSIEQNAFGYCYSVKFFDFTRHTAVPTLTDTSAFNRIPSDCEIRVPAALYDEWIAATNWSTYASQIVAV